MTLFWSANGATATTAAHVTQLTGTALRTMQQVQTASTRGLYVVAFGCEFASVLTVPCTVELIDTAAVACSGLTAAVAAGVQPYDDAAAAATASSAVTLGTAATGYYASGNTLTEGSTTVGRTLKEKILPTGAAEYEWEWSYSREPYVPASHNLRVRMTTATTVGAFTWILWSE